MNVLRIGDKGQAVRRLQQVLRDLGFAIAVDGDFGKLTLSAVRAFQEHNGLLVDGVAGKRTLAALGLDPDEDSDAGTDDSTITFDLDDTQVPTEVQVRIDEYVERLDRENGALLDVMRDALAQFETTMSFAPISNARPDALGLLFRNVFDFATGRVVGLIGKHIPGMSIVVAVWETVSRELEQAGQAATGSSIGGWIKDQRVIIDNARQSWDLESVREEVELQFLESNDRPRFLDELFVAGERLREQLTPSVSTLELKFYEAWINAHFRAIREDSPGCIEFRHEFEDSEFSFVSCTVAAPAGDRIEGSLNRLLDKQLVAGFDRPLDLRVRKRACFFVENLVGGTSWSCGWLDANNELIHRPLLKDAEQAIGDTSWRTEVHRFRRD